MNIAILKGNLMTGTTPVPGSTMLQPIYKDCLVVVGETKASRGFGFSIISVNHAEKKIYHLGASTTKFLDPELRTIIISAFTPIGESLYTFITNNPFVSNPGKSELLVESKLDLLVGTETLVNLGVKALSLNDRDTNNISLKDYISKKFMLMDTQGNACALLDMVAPAVTRKWATPKKEVNWDEFWNSPLLTDEEKDLCRCSLDIQVAYSNYHRPIRRIIERQFSCKYPTRKWVFNLLHGEPGSGKTSMVLKDICAMNNIPCLYLIGDARASLSKLIAIVGPTQTANGTVELTLQESVWAKCLKYNLPLVVFIDEIDTLSSLDLKQLGTLATEGKAVVNTTHYKNTAKSIYYFGAYNPGSTNASEFPDSFEDRLMWFSIPKVSEEEQINYRDIAYSSSLNSKDKEELVQSYNDRVVELMADFPELEGKLSNLSLAFTTLQLDNCNKEALDWYLSKSVSDTLPNKKELTDFIKGTFVDAYAEDVGDISYEYRVNKEISLFFNKMNAKLAELTRGIQTTKRNRNSTITIADRCYDVFVDLIFCYSSVAEAFKFMVMNRLPSGFVLNVPGASTIAGKDSAPESIYNALYNYMEADIEDLQKYLFSSVNTADVEEAYETYVKSLAYVPDTAEELTAEDVPSTESIVDGLQSNGNTTTTTLDYSKIKNAFPTKGGAQ